MQVSFRDRARELHRRSGFVDQERFLMTHWIDPNLSGGQRSSKRASGSEPRA